MFDWITQVQAATWAAMFSAAATAIAAITALQGPKSAAKLAEKMRQETEGANEKRRMKLFIFTTLMQERAAYYSAEAVKSFNLIDVVFNESRSVRDAWSDFLSAMDEKNGVPEHAQREKFRTLLSSMAADIGLADQLRSDDLNRFYYPKALQDEELLRSLQRKSSLQSLLAVTSPAANTAGSTSTSSEFPPAPSD